MTLKVLIKAINPPPPLLKGSSPESGKLVGSRIKGRGRSPVRLLPSSMNQKCCHLEDRFEIEEMQ